MSTTTTKSSPPILETLLLQILKRTTYFRGRGLFVKLWTRLPSTQRIERAVLPGGEEVLCNLAIPYELRVWLGHEDWADLEILRRLLRPGQVFVDCGANIGLWSISAAAVVGASGQVYAFEPNPTTYAKLEANIAHGKWAQIRAIPAAVGREPGEVLFHCDPAHVLSHIVESPEGDAISVPQTTLDQTLAGVPVAGCKLDVEGFELPALQGGEQMLKESRPWLCVEFNPHILGVDTLDRWPVHQYLRSLGYEARAFEDALNPSPATRLPDSWRAVNYCNIFYSVPNSAAPGNLRKP